MYDTSHQFFTSGIVMFQLLRKVDVLMIAGIVVVACSIVVIVSLLATSA